MAILEEDKNQSLKSILGRGPFDWEKQEESLWGPNRPTLDKSSLSPEQLSLYERLTAQDTAPSEKGTWEAIKAGVLPEVYGKEYAGAMPQERLEEKSLGGEVLGGIAYGALSFRKLPYQVAKIIGGDVLGSETVKQAVTPLIENIEALQQTPQIAPSKKAEAAIGLTGKTEKPIGEQITETITNPHFWAANLPPALWSIGEFFLYGGGAAALARKALGLEKALANAATPAAAAKIASKIDKMTKITGYGTGMAMEAAGAEENLRRWEKENPGKQISWAQRILVELGTGILAGSLEAFSFEQIFRGKQGMNLVRKVLDSIATEGATEGAQELVANAFRKYGYEPNQDLLEGVVESILIGAAVGGLAGAGTKARESIPEIRNRVRSILEGFKQERAAATTFPGATEEAPQAAPTPEVGPKFPIYRTGPTIQAGMARPILPPEKPPVSEGTGKQQFLPGFDYTVIIRPEERSGPLPPAPPGTPVLYGPGGGVARTPEAIEARWRVLADYEEALSKPPHQRTAEEKWLVDTVQRRGIEAALPEEFRTPGLGGPGVSTVLGPWGGPASAGPPSAGPLLDAQGRPIAATPPSPPELVGPTGRPIVKQALPPAFGGPRPEPIATPGDETTEAIETGREPVPPRPATLDRADLLNRVQTLARRVDQYGDPRDAQELSKLLAANRETLRDMFTVPPEDRSGLRPIAERLFELMQEVEETGDPGAARELHNLIAGNIGLLQGVRRWEIAREAGKFPEPIETGKEPEASEAPGKGPEASPEIQKIRGIVIKAFREKDYDIELSNPELVTELADIISKAGDWLNNEDAGVKLANDLKQAMRRAGFYTIEVLRYTNAILEALRKEAGVTLPPEQTIDPVITQWVINTIEPFEYGRAQESAWADNLSASPEYYSDGYMMIRASAIVASPALVKRVNLERKHKIYNVSKESIERTWNNGVDQAVYEIKIVGQWGDDEKSLSVLLSTDDNSRYMAFDKDRFDLLHHLVKFDEVRMADTPDKPAVFYRQGTPVAMLMSLDYPGIDVAAVKRALAEKSDTSPPDLDERRRRFIETSSHPGTAKSIIWGDTPAIIKDIQEGRITADEAFELMEAARAQGLVPARALDQMREFIEKALSETETEDESEDFDQIKPRPLEEFNTVDLADIFQRLIRVKARIRNQSITAKELAALAQKAFSIPQDRMVEYRKQIEEAFELALVREAREMVQAGEEMGLTPYDIFLVLQRLYNRQPALTSRTSETIRNQAYSTPVPLAYLMSRAVRLTKEDYVYEPTAGNGMLLIEANPEITLANELDPLRAQHLAHQGFHTSTEDAIGHVGRPGVHPKSFDVVLMNPPFGTLDQKVDFDGYTIRKLEHLIALHALRAMDDNGRAAIIIGGHSFATNLGKPTNELTGTDRTFFNYLYSRYNVTHHINISGDVYRRMGTSFPIRLLIIEGRKAVPDQAAAPYRPDQVEWAQTFEDVYNLLKSEIEEGKPAPPKSEEKKPLAEKGGKEQPPPKRPPKQPQDKETQPPETPKPPETPSPPKGGAPTIIKGQLADGTVVNIPVPPGVQPPGKGAILRMPDGRTIVIMEERAGFVVREEEAPPITWGDINWQDILVVEPGRWVETADGKVGRITKVRGAHDWGRVTIETETGTVTVSVKDVVRNVQEPKKEPKDQPPPPPPQPQPEDSAHQVVYRPVSKGPSLNCMAPKFMADALRKYITEFEKRVGKIDDYVANKLGYASKEEMHKFLGAEQVETVALAINAIENGPGGFIMGHQTGVGKGRVVAAMMRYARSQGLTPIFFTAHDKLFSDIYRDIEDITEENPPSYWAEFKPLIIASNAEGARVYRLDGTVLKELDTAAIQDALKHKKLTRGHNGVITTYYQIQGDRGAKHDLIKALAGNSLVILDESHKAAGQGRGGGIRGAHHLVGSNRRQFITEILRHAKGVVYSSATYAKRPDNLPLYFKTDIGTAVGVRNLVRVMQQGGVPLQEWVANQLALNGQMMRLELSFAGVSLEPKVDFAYKDYEREQSDKVTLVARKLVRFTKDLQDWIEAELSPQLIVRGENPRPTDIAKVSYTHFGSLMHNMVSQLLFALRVNSIVKEALAQAKENRKVVIACYNTMDAFINEALASGILKPGEPLNLTFSEILKRAVDKALYYRVSTHGGKTEKRRLLVSLLPPELQAAYRELEDLANTTTSELQATPIDVIGRALTKAGLRVGEITGRKWAADWTTDDLILRKRSNKERRDKNTPVNRFNSGDLDVLIINSAAAEGLSLHASERFQDQRQRVMIFGQLALDISDVIQLMGRIHRTGQVNLPIYKIILSSLPTEVRPLIVLTKKLTSLAANVTAKGETAYTLNNIKDSMNEYGDRVLAEMIAEDPEAMLAITGDAVSDVVDHAFMEVDFDTRVQILLNRFDEPGSLVKRVTGHVAIASVENQEKFFQTFDSRYDEYIETLKQEGEYNLGSVVMDLQAETLNKMPFVQGDPNSASGLLQPTYMETVRAKVQEKPYTAKEVQALINKTLKGRTPEQFRDELVAQVEKDFEAWVKTLPDTVANERRRRQVEAAARDELNTVKDALAVFLVGGRWDTETSMETTWSRVLTNVVYRPGGIGNPAKLSNFKLTFAQNTMPRRRTGTMRQFLQERTWGKPKEFGPGEHWNASILITEEDLKSFLNDYTEATNLQAVINRNEFGDIESISVEKPTSDSHKAAYNTLIGQFKEMKWDITDDPSRPGWVTMKMSYQASYMLNYELRHIVTGNLLSDFKGGQYVYFTRKGGEIEFGKLMPRSYDPAYDDKLQYVTMTVSQTEHWLKHSKYKAVVNHFHHVTIEADRTKEDTYRIQVPLSKQSGGKFYLDEEMLRLVGTFRSTPQRMMEAEFPAENLKKVLLRLQDKFGVTFSLERSIYNDFFGIASGGFYRVEEPPFKMVNIGGVGRRLVPNPKVAEEMRKKEEVIAYGSEWKGSAVVREGVKRATEVSKRIEALRTGRVPDRYTAQTYRARVALEYGKQRYVNITGYRLTPGQEAKELAELIAVFRTPKQENLHAVYVDKDGVVLAHTVMTSGALNYVAFDAKMFYDIIRRAERLGAAKVHFIHNHPSGDPTMSAADVFCAELWKYGSGNIPGLGDKMGEFVVIDGTTFSYLDWERSVPIQAHYNSRSMSGFLLKKEQLLTSADVAAFGSGLKLGSEEIAVVYLNTKNEINVCEIHHANLLNDDPEKVAAKLKARAKAFDSLKVLIITPSFVLTRKLLSEDVKLGDWLLDIITPSGLAASSQMPQVFETPAGAGEERRARRLFETPAEYQAATPQEVVDRYRDTYIALPEKKGLVQKLKEGVASLPEVFDEIYSNLVDRWGAWEKLALRTGTELAEKGLVIPAGENLVNCLSFMRGIEGRVRQGILGDHVYLDPMEYDEKTNQMVFSGEAPEVAGDSLVRRLEPLKEIAKRRGWSSAEVTSDLFHVLMPAQRDLELAGEYGNRLPGEIKGVHPEDSRAAIAALKAKYGEDDFARMDEVAESVRDWADAMILQPLLRVGMISRELYEDIKAKNQFYIPFKRLLEDLDDYVAANAGGAGVKGKVIHKIKGSEKQILDPLEMLIEMAYKANFAYARNRVYRGLYILAKYAEMEDIKEVPSKFVPVPVTLKQEIDSQLRPQLERLARSLGFEVKMLHSLGKKYLGLFRKFLNAHTDGEGGIIGEILVRFATTEKILSHELGHGLDAKYNLQNLLITQGTPEMKRELRRIADQRCGPGTPDSYRRYTRRREEQVAEFVNRYITERDVCRRTAPQTTAKFEEFLKSRPELHPILEFAPTARPDLRAFYTKVWVRSPLPPEPGTLPYYRNGVLRWLKVPPDIYNAAVNMMPSELGIFMRIAKFPADLLRAGAVLNPEFIARNPVRDIIQAWLFSSFGFNPLLWFRDVYQLLRKDPKAIELQRQWEAGGGPLATLAQSFTDPERITAEQIADPSKFRYFPHPLQALRHISAYFENLTRFSIYKQAREKGLTHAEAIHESRRTTLDYSRVGGHPAVRYLGMLIPFFNSAIQGMDKVVTELKGPNRKKVWFRLGILATVSILLYLLASRDKRYKELEPWERNYFWHIPLGPDQPIIRIPKPFEAGIMFGSVPVAMLEWALGRSEGKGVKQALEAAWQAATPEIVPTLVRPIVEFQANYDFFRGRAIEDAALKKLPVSLRAKPWTTELARAWGRHFGEATGISPVMMEHFIRTLGGGLGANYLLPGVDVILRKAGVLQDMPKPAQDAIERVWGVRAFFSKQPTGYRARSVADFFEKYQDVVQAEAAWRMLLKAGKLAEAEKYLQSHPEIMFARVARKAISRMGDLKVQRDNIYNDAKLTPEQKRAKLDQIDAQLLAISQKANVFMDPKVGAKVGLPSRKQSGQEMKDLDQYINLLLSPADRAFKKLMLQWPAVAQMDESKRRDRIVHAIRTELRLFKEEMERKAQDQKMQALRPRSIWDRATKEERERALEIYGTFIKVPTLWKTGFRLKREAES